MHRLEDSLWLVQVKLIYWGPTSVLVSWATGTATKGPQVSPVNAFTVGSHVIYGTEPGNLTENVEMTANNYVCESLSCWPSVSPCALPKQVEHLCIDVPVVYLHRASHCSLTSLQTCADTQTYQNHSFWDISYASPIFHYVRPDHSLTCAMQQPPTLQILDGPAIAVNHFMHAMHYQASCPIASSV